MWCKVCGIWFKVRGYWLGLRHRVEQKRFGKVTGDANTGLSYDRTAESEDEPSLIQRGWRAATGSKSLRLAGAVRISLVGEGPPSGRAVGDGTIGNRTVRNGMREKVE